MRKATKTPWMLGVALSLLAACGSRSLLEPGVSGAGGAGTDGSAQFYDGSAAGLDAPGSFGDGAVPSDGPPPSDGAPVGPTGPCLVGETVCGSSCVNLDSNPSHCG
ncbi:MAG TPA: hypothetical protein VFK43_12060, partial [Acidimicrobiales bacterium]|nr:hypothetical protein [Acidimicrobiales bacterium]